MKERSSKRVQPAAANGHASSDAPPPLDGGFALQLPAEALAPLIRQVVTETIAQLHADQAKIPDRLAFDEAQAAGLLGLEPHVLRDERRRGRIGASQIVGRRVRYTRDDLVNYLRGRRAQG